MEGDNITIVDEGVAREEKEAVEAQAEASIEIAKSSDEAACDIEETRSDAAVEIAKIEADAAIEIAKETIAVSENHTNMENDRWTQMIERLDRLESAVSALTMAETVELLTQQQSTETETETPIVVAPIPDHMDTDTSQTEDQEKEQHKESVAQEKIPLVTRRIWI